MNKRFKSYSFWTALAGAVVVFLNALGDCFGFSIDNDLVSGLIMAFAGLLVVLGVVTMPKDSENSQSDAEDDKEEESQENSGKNDENSEKGE